ncbi:MAG: hypothetical protein IH987_03865 [Planctomycetes bacterium]|nr:hypothetical protein [Planctomycetota bacterium]
MRTTRVLSIACGIILIWNFPAQAAEFEWVPVSASGTHTINGNTIVLVGGGQEVTIDLRLSGWDADMNGDPLLGAFQVTVDSSGYNSGAGAALNPLGWPDSPEDGAFQILNRCTVNLLPDPNGQPCVLQSDCSGEACVSNLDWVFFGLTAISAVATGTLDYEFASAAQTGGASDNGTSSYGATIILDVPANAAGAYTIGFVDNPNQTFMRDANAGPINGIILTPIIISIACATDPDCDDGSACTDDVCNPDQTCSNSNNFDDALFCCDPATGSTTPLDDGNECTDNVCDPATGVVTHPPLPSGTVCGSPAADACDAQDTCDGAGVCVDRAAPMGTACGDPSASECDNPDSCDGTGICRADFEPPGTACGDPTDTDCNGADTCTGSGTCESNILSAGTACGDPTDSECDDPDTCDGAGTCLPNREPAGLPCGNPIGNLCDNPDTCDGAGACQTNPFLAGTPCGNPSFDECDNADSCDGAGACDPNHVADGSPCTDDGNECRDDVCQAGACTHPLEPAGTSCGDPSNSECDQPDSCNATGACEPNLQPPGAACGDPTITDCDRADSCDGAGACLGNLEPAGMGCGDPADTDCDDPDTCDGNGACRQNVAPGGLPCGNQVGNQCDNPDTCDGSGTCDTNFVLVGTACGNPSISECDNPDTCDGSGTCDSNHVPDTTLCSDDGNECRADVCLDGVCAHPAEPASTPCGDPADTDCDNPDACDGAGTCLPNVELVGVPCDDPTANACTDPDTCNGFGNCLPNHQPDGTDCDDGSFCNAGATCVSGACGGGTAVDCNDGLICTADSCNEAQQQCDNLLIPGNCLIVGTCFQDGELNPVNDCEMCDSAIDLSNFSFLSEGTSCVDGDTCTDNDACDAFGVCTGTVDPNCNDDCVNAVEVFDGSNIGNNDNRGPDDDEATCQFDSDNDVWFFYVATCSGPVLMDSEGSVFTPFNDTVLTVYDACGGNEVACDDDGGTDLLSALAFLAVDGATYYIRVAGFMNNSGDIVLNISTATGCVIDGICYDQGELNPANGCELCTPLLSSTDWSSQTAGSACGDPAETACDSPDACNGAGVCETNHKSDLEACPDDGNDCTDDICFAGDCAHPPKSVGTPCGDLTGTQCDAPDTCDGAGVCESNFTPLGTSCGDASISDCDNADICDGSGSCDSNHQPDDLACTDDGVECTQDLCATGACEHPPQPVGTSCGDGSNTQCDNPDTCDGGGLCLDNFETGGATCGDPTDTDCDNPDSCNGSGACVENLEPIGTACGDPADTECDNADTCNGDGACLANFEVNEFPCGDPASTQCDNPDTCNGGGTCLTNLESAGLACGDPSSSDCDNADICDGVGSCDSNHQPDGLACTDEGVQCTQDLCDTGACVHPPQPAGTPCGDGSNTQCDNPDTCDGAGVCQDNFETGGAACGDPADSDCDHPDSCNGSGACVDNLEPGGTACGDPADTECDNADTCDDGGACLANLEPNGFPCGDPQSTQCDNPDTCNGGGTCLTNFESVGLACGDPSLSDCDNPDSCDGAGGCAVNHQPDGLTCTDEGLDCTIDECGGGTCLHPPILVGTPCGDGSNTQCDNPDSCDGAGTCLANLESAGFACGDPTDTDCDNPDSCNGAGACLTNLESTGFACGDPADTDCDDPDTCDGSGICLDNFEINGFPCGDETNTQCDNPDTCDGVGLCLDNFELVGVSCGNPFDDQCDNPDICDGVGECDPNFEPTGTPCDDSDICTADDTCSLGTCAGTAIPTAPLVVTQAPKALHVTPQPPASVAPVALRLTSPDWPCLDKFIDAEGSLVDTPVVQLPADWATVIVRGEAIVPSTLYEVVAECGSFVSPVGSDSTCLWADVNCNGITNINDAFFIILGFQAIIPPELTFEALDIWPCEPNRIINFVDVQRAILAFQGQSYAETGCPVPCP